MRVAIVGAKPPEIRVRIRVWTCKNCGHEEPLRQGSSLKELKFTWLGPLTSRVTCPACQAYTLQKAYDATFYAGNFLMVVPKNVIRGKG
ncbi:MAG: hypothetical protein NHB14_20915 [Desulfosporosinus sp.]|nr:hypothetical protein [Desulfosporosinus sp.]